VTNAASPFGIISSNAVVTLLPDTDGDGLPDEWEIVRGLNPTNAADATLDNDHDGCSNLQEYLAGTDPQDPESRLKIDSIEWSTNGNGLTLIFMAVSNRTYTVQSSPFAGNAAWSRVLDVTAAASNRTARVTDQFSPELGQRFYRLTTPRSP
jgi:hypothetical protein